MSSELLSGYLSQSELAAQLGVTTRTLQMWDAQRKGPPKTLVGKKVMFARASAQDWLKSLEQQPVRERHTRARHRHERAA